MTGRSAIGAGFGVLAVILLLAADHIWSIKHGSPAVARVACAPPKVAIGMTPQEVLVVCGKPAHISHTIAGGGRIERQQWAYRDPTAYVYIQDGVVDSMQYSENGEDYEVGR